MWWWVLLGLVVAERGVELVVARRNLRWSLARGATEAGRRHFPLIVALHVGLLAGCVVESLHRPVVPALAVAMVCLVLGAQALRWWCIATLGRQWNTRILVVPDAPRVDRGPYRYLPHPNYVAVVVEGFALPLAHTAWVTALAFTVLDALVLRHRIAVEDSALAAVNASGG